MSNFAYNNPLKTTFPAAVLAVAMSFAASAFAGGTHKSGHGGDLVAKPEQGHSDSLPFGEPGKAADVTRTITVDMGDNFFAMEKIVVKPGKTVRFVLKNGGEFLHEFNIGTAAMHAAHQEEMMAMMESGMMTPTGMNQDAMKMDHGAMKKGMHEHNDPNSVLLEPGQTKELIWQFAEATGLEFACNVPGHYESGMMGAFEFGTPQVGS